MTNIALNNLKKIRLENNLSIYELSKITGISEFALYQYENNNDVISLKHVIQLCSFFNITSDYLLFNENRKALDISTLDNDRQSITINLYSNLKKLKVTYK